ALLQSAMPPRGGNAACNGARRRCKDNGVPTCGFTTAACGRRFCFHTEHPMSKPRLVMVGNGMAGVRTLQELLQAAPGLYDITVFGAEPHPHYNRILLSPVLAGEQTLDEIILNDWPWYAQNGIALHAGFTVTHVDRTRRVVHAANGAGEVRSAAYDRLILATGSNPFMLPVPGKD